MHRALGDRGCVVLINFRARHEQCCHLFELAVVAGHHINSAEAPDYSSCFGDHSLAKTAFQIRGRVFDDTGCDQIGEIKHGPIIRRPSCHLLRGKLTISQGSVRNLLSAATLKATVLNRAIVLKRVCAPCPPTTPCATTSRCIHLCAIRPKLKAKGAIARLRPTPEGNTPDADQGRHARTNATVDVWLYTGEHRQTGLRA